MRKGSCNRFCGRCCTAIAPEHDTMFEGWFNPPFEGLKANGECAHLSWQNGMATCGIYDHRPSVCRTFPTDPQVKLFFPTCTYTFEGTP